MRKVRARGRRRAEFVLREGVNENGAAAMTADPAQPLVAASIAALSRDRVGDDDGAAAPFDEAAALHGVDLARHGLPAGVDARGELGLVRRRDDDRALRIVAVGPREAQELGVDARADVERAEFADPAATSREAAGSASRRRPRRAGDGRTSSRRTPVAGIFATTESVTAKTLAARGAPSKAAISPKIEPACISLKMRSWRAMLSTALRCPLMMK